MVKTIDEYEKDISDVVDRVKFTQVNPKLFEFKSGVGEWDLSNVQKFNFFVGENNSGKSRVLREIFGEDFGFWDINSDLLSVDDLLDRIVCTDFKQQLRAQNFSYLGPEDIVPVILEMKKSPPPAGVFDIADQIYERATRGHGTTSTRDRDLIYSALFQPLSSADPTLSEKTEYLGNFSRKYTCKVYIPTLRTLRHISDEDLYLSRTAKDYFKNSDLNSDAIFTGHNIAEDLKQQLLGTHKQRKKVREFEQFLSEQFFYGADIALTPRIDDNVVWFKEGDKDEHPIYDLGDGIQAIIILTYKVFMAEHPTIFFIEEPEKYLHAGMQRTLVEALASVPHHMFFMTTHSNHFLDLALERDDVATHQVSQHEGKTLTRSATELNDLLDELGVRASSVLLANCSIWVEGVTDKLYLRAYMSKYLIELEDKGTEPDRVNRLKSHIENLHYVFVEYQGSNITHWAFNHEESDLEKTSAYLLNNKIFLLADGDIDQKGDRTENLSSWLGKQFYQLELKEIENYIPLEVMKKTAELRLNVMNQRKGCSLNFDSFTQGSYAKKTVGIGRYLELCVEKPKGLEKSFFEEIGKSKTGTIRDKVAFCKEAVRYMNSHPEEWMLTDELTELCDKLWHHVEKSN
ncbi:ATP-dependent nuclease [Vibrio atlanticus]|uniref:ATP-dependent nuclease n=1 Tax=Vibrio atlanticus TaxID=693153 RepID=UPI003552A292